MAIAGSLALLAASTPAALSRRREFPSPASLLRREANSPAALPGLAAPPRSAAARCSLAVVRDLEDNTQRLNGVKSKKVIMGIKRKVFSSIFCGIIILIGVLVIKSRI